MGVEKKRKIKTIGVSILLIVFWLMFWIPIHYFLLLAELPLYIIINIPDYMVCFPIIGIFGTLFVLAYLASCTRHDEDLSLYVFLPMVISTLIFELFWYF